MFRSVFRPADNLRVRSSNFTVLVNFARTCVLAVGPHLGMNWSSLRALKANSHFRFARSPPSPSSFRRRRPSRPSSAPERTPPCTLPVIVQGKVDASLKRTLHPRTDLGYLKIGSLGQAGMRQVQRMAAWADIFSSSGSSRYPLLSTTMCPTNKGMCFTTLSVQERSPTWIKAPQVSQGIVCCRIDAPSFEKTTSVLRTRPTPLSVLDVAMCFRR